MNASTRWVSVSDSYPPEGVVVRTDDSRMLVVRARLWYTSDFQHIVRDEPTRWEDVAGTVETRLTRAASAGVGDAHEFIVEGVVVATVEHVLASGAHRPESWGAHRSIPGEGRADHDG